MMACVRDGIPSKAALRAAVVLASMALLAGSLKAADDALGPEHGVLHSEDAIETILEGLNYRASYVRGMAGTFIMRHADDAAALQRAEAAGRTALGAEGAGSDRVIGDGSLETAYAAEIAFQGSVGYVDIVELEHGVNYIGFEDYEHEYTMPPHLPFWLRRLYVSDGNHTATIDYSTGICVLGTVGGPIWHDVDAVRAVQDNIAVTIAPAQLTELHEWMGAAPEYRPRMVGLADVDGMPCTIVDFPGRGTHLRLWIAYERDFAIVRVERLRWSEGPPVEYHSYRIETRSGFTNVNTGLWVPQHWEAHTYVAPSDGTGPWLWRGSQSIDSRNLRMNDQLAEMSPSPEASIPLGFHVRDDVRGSSYVAGGLDEANDLGFSLPSDRFDDTGQPKLVQDISP